MMRQAFETSNLPGFDLDASTLSPSSGSRGELTGAGRDGLVVLDIVLKAGKAKGLVAST